ncbi:MAG: cupredoxin domain-containing protein [Candidatus Tyrphobacter sp.]
MADLILEIFLVAATVAIAAMLFLANYRTHDALAQQVVMSRGYAVRRYWFWLVLIVAIATFALTIPYFPYPRAITLARAQHFTVIAQQYGFTLAAVIPLDRLVVFDVTSRDVNHGFGIYGPNGAIVGQVQAMPGYVNHLPMTFTVPGHYTIRCLEYCGIAHDVMQGGFNVR